MSFLGYQGLQCRSLTIAVVMNQLKTHEKEIAALRSQLQSSEKAASPVLA
jgi:hypothetical protein